MTRIPLYQVDAFTDAVFGGNPAAVCPVEDWPPDPVMQAIAAENNLSETAFFIDQGDHFDLRWFTPAAEVDLCGHATLATAWVLFNELGIDTEEVAFDTRSGRLTVRSAGDWLVMDFPARPPTRIEPSPTLAEALGHAPHEVLCHENCIAVFDSEDEVRDLAPDIARIKALDFHGVIVTAPGDEVDFVSRYFAPRYGIPEDPVTGSAHCELVPYWANRLDTTKLSARQISARGGELRLELAGDRVRIGGQCAKFLEGIIEI